MSASKVLHERMPGNDHPRTAVLFEPAHRDAAAPSAAVVAFDAVVGVLVGPMPRRCQQLIEHRRIRRCPVGGDLDRHDPRRVDHPLKNRRAAAVSRRGETNTSMTWPNWSTAR
jgi:hypothetical protein